jgi:negative regulator of flagellin synthesis FlgM
MSRIQEFDVSSRIKGTDGSAVEGSRARGVDRVRPTSATRAPATVNEALGSTDSVEITSSAHQLLDLQQALSELPDVDLQKVERIRMAIDGQTYRVDAARIADRLLQMDSDLTATRTARKY